MLNSNGKIEQEIDTNLSPQAPAAAASAIQSLQPLNQANQNAERFWFSTKRDQLLFAAILSHPALKTRSAAPNFKLKCRNAKLRSARRVTIEPPGGRASALAHAGMETDTVGELLPKSSGMLSVRRG